MTLEKNLVILLVVIFTFTLGGCDVFNDDTGSTEKPEEELSITQVQNLPDLYVEPGTEEAEVIDQLNSKRNKVDIVLSDGSEVVAEVVWKGANGNFNPEEMGRYEFEGTVYYHNNDLSTDISIDVVVENISVFDVEKDFSSIRWFVTGKLKNLNYSKIEYIEIHVEVYNNQNDLITSEYTVKENIAKGETVDWAVAKFTQPQSDSYYKIVLKNIQVAE